MRAQTFDPGAGGGLLEAEEARGLESLLQTMPLAQGFRGSAVPGALLVLEWALTADHWLDYKTVLIFSSCSRSLFPSSDCL